MIRNRLLAASVLGVVCLGIGAAIGADKLLNANAAAMEKQEVKPAVSLPITRVVLFNSGVGYFSRTGDVVDDARVDLMFPEQDINDLLKSMVLEDFNDGRIAAVSYDSREPISRTLSSFAINLNGNPTFATILLQMRGERVDVVLAPGTFNQPGKLSGTIVGLEVQRVVQSNTMTAVEILNLWCAEGLRSVKLSEIQQLKFTNPVIESEFRRALDVLALGHDSQKKAVSLHFAGEGKRKVQVGYVVEAPIWKTSYRLVLADKEKPYLQGWAMVENTTDEDWAGVKMALISGRPISFKMDLYNPLYVDRPVVEPELFASLRPVTYRGGFDARQLNRIADSKSAEVRSMFEKYRQLVKQEKYGEAEIVALALKDLEPDNPACVTLAEMAKLTRAVKDAESLKDDREKTFRLGLNAAEREGPMLDVDNPTSVSLERSRVARSRGANDQNAAFAKETAAEMGRRLGTGTVGNAATAGALGDFFQYTIDHPVSLARQKSAMLPIVGKEIEGQRVSIYNQFVQGTHPLLGLKFKNTSGLHLNQGPITVFEGSVYAGDTRVLDVQPNEERIVSYAIDLGVEVDPQNGPGTQKITSVKAVKGIVTTTTKLMEQKKYRIVNRSQGGRTLIIEHPNRINQQFKLVETEKPLEETPDVLRFQTTLKAGENKTYIVKEQKDLDTSVVLSNTPDALIRYYIDLSETNAGLKQKLKESLALKAKWDGSLQELKQVAAELATLNADQDRIRKNLRETPKEAEVYAIYLKKLSDQEKEIDKLTERQKKLMTEEYNARKSFEEYLANLSD
jgi:hypothetical protein